MDTGTTELDLTPLNCTSKVATRRGHSTYGSILFTVVSNRNPNKHELSVIQAELGYHPCGYGGPNEITHKSNGGMGVVTTWTCYGSCD